MINLLLVFHILAGTTALVSSAHVFSEKLSRFKGLFLPSVMATIISGVGMIIYGASITRVCISGGLLIVVLIGLNRISVRTKNNVIDN